jgi:hypothetical protein
VLVIPVPGKKFRNAVLAYVLPTKNLRNGVPARFLHKNNLGYNTTLTNESIRGQSAEEKI